MTTMPQRFEHVRRNVRVGKVLAFLGVLLLAIVGAYLFIGQTEFGAARYLVGMGVFAAAIVLAASLIFVWGVVDVLLKIEGNSHRIYDTLRDVQTLVQDNQQQLREISENVQLSDIAKTITHRDRERTALRMAINEEIIRGDWEAAYSLVEVLASRHGYKNEAMRLRQEVDESRERDRKDKLHEAVEHVRSLMATQDWDRARREMDRLLAEMPGVPEVAELPKLFARSRSEHKRRLLKAWDETVQRNEVDRSIAILKELDQYLTRNEAAALEESVRGVFRVRLQNLAVQFALAVEDHDWRQALTVSQDIVREFPNSRMALEVRERAALLTKRAQEQEAERVAAAAAAQS